MDHFDSPSLAECEADAEFDHIPLCGMFKTAGHLADPMPFDVGPWSPWRQDLPDVPMVVLAFAGFCAGRLAAELEIRHRESENG